MTEKAVEFLEKLASLLTEYNANIELEEDHIPHVDSCHLENRLIIYFAQGEKIDFVSCNDTINSEIILEIVEDHKKASKT